MADQGANVDAVGLVNHDVFAAWPDGITARDAHPPGAAFVAAYFEPAHHANAVHEAIVQTMLGADVVVEPVQVRFVQHHPGYPARAAQGFKRATLAGVRVGPAHGRVARGVARYAAHR